jgi:hypothetical protein
MRRKVVFRLFLFIVLVLLAIPVVAQNPHDGYAFWLPSGELKIGDAASEKEFNYSSTATSQTFTVKPRSTRMGVPAGQIVIIWQGFKLPVPAVSVDGKGIGNLFSVTFIPVDATKDKAEIKIEIKAAPTPGTRYLFYYTDDSFKLSQFEFEGGDKESYYHSGIVSFWQGNYKQAKSTFLTGEARVETPEAKRLMRRLARWADAEAKFKKLKSGPAYYKMGLYCLTNGFWDLAADSFQKATELMPKDADAWYMLGDATSYKLSDLDMKMEKIIPYYQKAADLYPTENSNTYRNHIGSLRSSRSRMGTTMWS